MRSMKIKGMIRLAISTSIAVSASLWLGCGRAGSSASPATNVARTAAEPTQSDGWEYKTVDKAMSEAELRQHMQQWQQEGWAVLSISRALPQPDGTVHRKVELRKARQ